MKTLHKHIQNLDSRWSGINKAMFSSILWTKLSFYISVNIQQKGPGQ